MAKAILIVTELVQNVSEIRKRRDCGKSTAALGQPGNVRLQPRGQRRHVYLGGGCKWPVNWLRVTGDRRQVRWTGPQKRGRPRACWEAPLCPVLNQIPTTVNAFASVPEEKYLTLEGFHKFVVDRAKQDIRSVWRAILSCGYDLHFER